MLDFEMNCGMENRSSSGLFLIKERGCWVKTSMNRNVRAKDME